MNKILKYIFCLIIGISFFFSGTTFGAGGNCFSYEPCDYGYQFDENCNCVEEGGSVNGGGINPNQGGGGDGGIPSGGDGQGAGGDSSGGSGGPTCPGDKIFDSSIQDCTGCLAGTIPNDTQDKCVCNPDVKCCGIQLNTVVPFIGDCIEMNTDSSRGDTTSVNSVTAFPILMQGLMKIVMSVIMIFSFLMVIASGLMMTTGAFSSTNFDKGKTILKNVLISLILLGSSGLILSLINPSFFGG